ncbi:MAG TPA: acyltransferase, partial [Myxococcota bacterium]
LFFVISGFLIVTLLLRERDRRGDISLKNFYVRRFLRIFPLYYGVLAALTFAFLVVAKHANMAPAFFHDLPFALTYTSNWADVITGAGLLTFLEITWSLSAEEQFYVVWPPAERFLRRATLPLLGALLTTSVLIQFGVFDSVFVALGVVEHSPRMLKETGFTPMLLGVVLAHALHAPSPFARVSALLSPTAAAPTIVAAIVVVSLPIDDISGGPRLLVHLLMTALVGACVVREDHGLRRLLRWRPLVEVGVLSYGLYLLHMPVRIGLAAVLEKLGALSSLPLFVGTTVVTVVVAWLSFTLYEQRFLRLKERFSA